MSERQARQQREQAAERQQLALKDSWYFRDLPRLMGLAAIRLDRLSEPALTELLDHLAQFAQAVGNEIVNRPPRKDPQ